MPLRQIRLLCDAVVELLKCGNRPAWVWRNDIAWALKLLVEQGRIIREGSKKAPDGGSRGVYGLSY
jgi:hypothetical protein